MSDPAFAMFGELAIIVSQGVVGSGFKVQALFSTTLAGQLNCEGLYVLGVLLESDRIFHDSFCRFLCDCLLGTSRNPRQLSTLLPEV